MEFMDGCALLLSFPRGRRGGMLPNWRRWWSELGSLSLFGCNRNVESKGYFGVFSRGINFLLGKIICALGTLLLGVAFGCFE